MSILLLDRNISYPVADDVNTSLDEQAQNPKPKPRKTRWFLLIIYCVCLILGGCAPFFQRLYYNHGGSLKWLQSGLQAIGAVVILPILAVIYFTKKIPLNAFFMDLRLFVPCLLIGVIYGFANYMYTTGLSSIPVSTTALLFSTELAFVALFASILVKQKFTFYSINAILLITLAAVVLSLHTSSDKPAGVTKGKYLLGFFCTLGGAVLAGLTSPLLELGFSKTRKTVTYVILMQALAVINLSATFVSIVGMLIHKDFQRIPKEAKTFAIGETKYYLILVGSAIFWQLGNLGLFGIISCSSALLGGVFSSALLPFNQLFSVIIFHEKFTAEKGLSLALSLWGFASYFIGEYRKTKAVAEPKDEAVINNENGETRVGIDRSSSFV